MSGESRPPRSLEEARELDVGEDMAGRDEPPPPAPPAGPCLMCSDPGTGGVDVYGNEYCPRHWAEREARIAESLRARSGRRWSPDEDPPMPGVGREAIRQKIDHLRERGSGQSNLPIREPYRDE